MAERPDTGSGRRRLVTGAALLAVLLVALSPLVFVEVPPLVDYPNHLARAFITAEIADDEVLRSAYRVEWALLPRLAMDALLPLLFSIAPVYDVSPIPVAAIFVVWMAAAMTLHRVLFGVHALWPALSVLFLYNAPLGWGFMSYMLTSGFVVLAFALWIGSAGRAGWPRRLGFLAFAVLAFLGHLVAYGLFCLLVGCHELGRLAEPETRRSSRARRDIAANLALLPVPLLLMLRVEPAHGTFSTIWGDLPRKLEALLSPTLQYNFAVDIPLWLASVLVLAVALATRRLRLSPRLYLPLAGLVLVALAMPFRLFGVPYMDIRLPFVVFVLLLAGSRIHAERRLEARALVLVFLAMLACRVWSTHVAWRAHDADYREFIAATSEIGTGARLLTAAGDDAGGLYADALTTHVAAFAVIERRVFLPNLFTGTTILKTQPHLDFLNAPQPLPVPVALLGREYRRSCRGEEPPPARLPGYLHHWQRNFDYLAILQWRARPAPRGLPLASVATGRYFAIYRISDTCAGGGG